jgi:hypothetical protein
MEANRKARTGPGFSNVSLALNLNDGDIYYGRCAVFHNTVKCLTLKASAAIHWPSTRSIPLRYDEPSSCKPRMLLAGTAHHLDGRDLHISVLGIGFLHSRARGGILGFFFYIVHRDVRD